MFGWKRKKEKDLMYQSLEEEIRFIGKDLGIYNYGDYKVETSYKEATEFEDLLKEVRHKFFYLEEKYKNYELSISLRSYSSANLVDLDEIENRILKDHEARDIFLDYIGRYKNNELKLMDINFNLLYDLSMRYAYDVLRALNRIAESDSDKLILSDWEENLSRVVKKPYYYSSNYNKEKLMPYLGAYFVDQKARDSLYEYIKYRR
jgi:hypothetical protein